MDILRDIIVDMQQEIDQLKKKTTGIVSWYHTSAGGLSGDLLSINLKIYPNFM